MTNRELFELHFKTTKDFKFYIKHEMAESQVLEFKCGEYVVNCVNEHWQTWQAATQREGFKFVPVEADAKMIKAGRYAHDSSGLIGVAYKAMIGAVE